MRIFHKKVGTLLLFDYFCFKIRPNFVRRRNFFHPQTKFFSSADEIYFDCATNSAQPHSRMLSILIPAYNHDCRSLARSLSQQADSLSCPVEIIVADDGSDDTRLRSLNAEIAALPHCRYIVREENVGRAAIRNFLAGEARGEWLLFMDCDGQVVYLRFLQNYLDAAHDCDVVCGGIVHTQQFLTAHNRLRYDYERRAEQRFTAQARQQDAELPFRTFCFMIRREAFERVRFDESFRHYGYEDVLFGRQLRAAGLVIRHIDNPLENTDIETNPVFVAKTEEALRTLRDHEPLFADDVRLLRLVRRLQSWHLLPLVRRLAALIAPPLRRNLCTDRPLTRLFDLYKLCYYCQL